VNALLLAVVTVLLSAICYVIVDELTGNDRLAFAGAVAVILVGLILVLSGRPTFRR
jgi:hydrogenase-4 membrane subunit HyfE